MSVKKTFPVIGWREWLGLPTLGVQAVKAKIDTGARSSAIHAVDVEIQRKKAGDRVRFVVHPTQRSTEPEIECVAQLHEERWVRSSNGKRELRPVIITPLLWNGVSWDIELTLTSRDSMGFRMLLGRQALKGRVLINPSTSYLGGRPGKRK